MVHPNAVSIAEDAATLQLVFHDPAWLSELAKGINVVNIFHHYPTMEKSSAFILHSSMKDSRNASRDPPTSCDRQSLEEDREPCRANQVPTARVGRPLARHGSEPSYDDWSSQL